MSLDTTFSAFDVVQLSHALNFLELDPVAVLVRVALVFVDSDDKLILFVLVNRSHNILLGRLAIFVEHNMGVAKVDEGVSRHT
jgi:hypothetical protein